MGLGERADAHEGGGDGHVDLFGEGAELRMRLGADQATAGVEDRALGLADQFEDLLELVVRGVVHLADVGILELDRPRVDRTETGLLDVLRNVDHHRTRPTGAGEVEGLLEDAGEVVGVEH